ncbi:MAG: hypothetical protein PVJ06_11340 [Desulfobacterales bacterium]|jgi:hypothetical protein
MKLKTDEIETLVFRPEDGSFSSAVKIIHQSSGNEYICDEFKTQIENRRACLQNLIRDLSTKFKGISFPKYMPFDSVKVLRPNTERSGRILELIWHFKNKEWNYYIDSEGKRISKRYVESDLERLDT